MLTTPSVATDIILFGAKGDLATRKLVPALFNLYCNNRIHPESKIIGVARTQLSSKEYRQLPSSRRSRGHSSERALRPFGGKGVT